MTPSYHFLGKWAEKNYNPWILSSSQDVCHLSLTYSITHPIMKGVKSISGETTMVDVKVSEDSLVIAKSESNLFVTEKRISKFATVIGINVYHVNLSEWFWKSDGSRLIENAFQYASTHHLRYSSLS